MSCQAIIYSISVQSFYFNIGCTESKEISLSCNLFLNQCKINMFKLNFFKLHREKNKEYVTKNDKHRG